MTALAVTPNTAEWLSERKKHIGASDAPAILGLTPNWRKARDVAKDKLDTAAIEQNSDNKFFKRGHILEPLVKYFYIENSGNELFSAPMYRHQQHEWMAATPDAWIAGENFEALLECKTANRYSRHEWIDILDDDTEIDVVPMKYWVQVQHQMAVTAQERVFVAVIFAGEDLFDMLVGMLEGGAELTEVYAAAKEIVDYKLIEVARDNNFIHKLIGIEREFWANISAGILPVEHQYLQDNGAIRIASYEEECLLTDLKTAYLQKLLAEEDFEECSEKVKKAIGNDSGIYSEITGRVTYRKSRNRRKTNWKNFAEDLLARFVNPTEQTALRERYTTSNEVSRRFSFPHKLWRFN